MSMECWLLFVCSVFLSAAQRERERERERDVSRETHSLDQL